MVNPIVPKHSATAGKVPLSTDLLLGELAVNTNDGKLFLKKNNGADVIVEVGVDKEPIIAAGTATQYYRGDKTWQMLDKSAVGLPNVENKSSATIRSELTAANVTGALTYTPLDAAKVGAASGVTPLGADSKVPAAYLPSYVDDVLEYANQAAFPATGSSGIIYVADDTNKVYRWSGSGYVEVSPSPGSTDAVPEGASNQYFTPARVLSTILAGLSTASSAVVTAADSVLSAIGKLQAQVTARAMKGANNDITSLSGLTTALSVQQGGTGTTTLTGYVKGNGTGALTASSSIPTSDLSGNIDGGTY